MAVDRTFPNSGTGSAYVAGVKEEGEALWQYSRVPLTNVAGTANDVTADCVVPIASYADGQRFRLKATATNTGPMTIDIDEKGVKDLVAKDGTALRKGQVRIGGVYDIDYVAATGDFYLLNSDAEIGRRSKFISASEMIVRTSNGPANGSVEATTNKVMMVSKDFDPSTVEYVQYWFLAPANWDEGPMTAKFVWKHAATSVNFGVRWGIQGLAVSDDDPLDAAFGTAAEVTDTGGTTNDLYTSPETAAFTFAGSPAAGDWIGVQIYRAAAHAADTMAIDAGLLGVMLFFNIDAASED